MTDYHKQEILHITQSWTDEQLDAYIGKLLARIDADRELIRDLKAQKRIRNRNKNLKDTGPRGGM